MDSSLSDVSYFLIDLKTDCYSSLEAFDFTDDIFSTSGSSLIVLFWFFVNLPKILLLLDLSSLTRLEVD